MSVPAWAGFVAYIPDDEVATGEDIAVFGGRNVAVAVGEIFASLGCSYVSDPNYSGEVGWDFRFRRGERHSFWCRVQSFHPIYWLLLEGPGRKRDEPTHLELWQQFAAALEQDSRFDQILWRSSKDGPPDWDEFTITDDLPAPAVLAELPATLSKPRPKAAGGSLAPIAIGVWFTLTMAVAPLVERFVPDAKAQDGIIGLIAVALLLGLAFVLRIIDRLRKRGRQSSDDDLNSRL
jgi:hypothetical protein